MLVSAQLSALMRRRKPWGQTAEVTLRAGSVASRGLGSPACVRGARCARPGAHSRSHRPSDVQLTLDELKAHRGRGRSRAEQLHEYLTRFKDAVHYDAFKAAGLPIGSGEIEAAHRIVPQKRLKLAGAWWSEGTVNPMLALRVLRANGWRSEFWAKREAA